MKSNFTFILSIRGFPLCSSKIPLNLTFNRKKTKKKKPKRERVNRNGFRIRIRSSYPFEIELLVT